ncbi:MAG: response regulator transcription factor [Hydrogenophilus thermoluteolus]|jgi:DNA-binding response OmpR family regulator|nr:response regulator [Hydrogenophilus thermoluteolus]MBW7656058.1 response regulator [Hydrogenophilus thermoluteolus]HCO76904.1 two-component system response regulator [Rhodocyclaceae bacterium]
MSHKILVVDDEEAISLALEFLLQRAGYEVAVARDGVEALERIAAWRPDLVLLDIMMPGKDGFEVCQSVREMNDLTPQPKIVMLTAKGRDVERTKGLAVGADDYVVKPFSTEELLQRIARHLGQEAA